MSKSFLARLAATAMVALSVSAVAPRQDRPAQPYATIGTTSSTHGLKIRTSCGMSGYMVAVG